MSRHKLRSALRQEMYKMAGIQWLLRDDFTDTRAAGAVDGTPATPGPGTRDVVTDTNSKISVGSGVLDFATGGANQDGVWYKLFTRKSGRLHLCSVTLADTTGRFLFGLDDNQLGSIDYQIRFFSTGVIELRLFGVPLIAVGTYSATTYKVCVITGNPGNYWFIKGGTFSNWTMLYYDPLADGNYYPTIGMGTLLTIFTVDYIRIPLQTWLPMPLAYDTFTRSDGAMGSTEAIGPDGQRAPVKAWTGAGATIVSNKAIITPTQGSELVANGEMEGTYDDESSGGGGTINLAPGFNNVGCETDGTDLLDESVDAHGGSKAQKIIVDAINEGIFTAGTVFTTSNWSRISVWIKGISGNVGLKDNGGDFFSAIITSPSGAYTEYIFTTLSNQNSGLRIRSADGAANFLVDDISIKNLTLSTLFSSLEVSNTNILAAATASVFVTGTQMGGVTHLDDAATPANFLLSYIDGTNIRLDKCVAGVYTPLISIAQAYVSGVLPELHAWRDGNDLKVRLYYDGAFIGTEQTVSDAGIIDNTIHGLFSTYDGNKFDTFTIQARGQNDNSHNFLNRFIS